MTIEQYITWRSDGPHRYTDESGRFLITLPTDLDQSGEYLVYDRELSRCDIFSSFDNAIEYADGILTGGSKPLHIWHISDHTSDIGADIQDVKGQEANYLPAVVVGSWFLLFVLFYRLLHE